MTKKYSNELREGLAETYFYRCHECKTEGLSRDDVHSVKTGNGIEHFICLHCMESIPNFQKED